MKMPFSKVFLVTAIVAAVVPAHTYAESSTETISYNYVYDNISGYRPENVHNRQMEKLGRGLTAVRTSEGVYLSWRLLDSEDCIYGSADDNVSFNIYRDNETEPIANVAYSTNYIDKTVGTSYRVAPVVNDEEGKCCSPVGVMENSYIDIELNRPEPAVLPDGIRYEYTAGDASCGDLDGDGEYEIVLKWDCHARDNSEDGYSGNVLIDAYELDGEMLWRIDLGQNIRAGAHYTQFLVYDLDNDGRAEVTAKTAPGSKDGYNTVNEDGTPDPNGGEYVTRSSRIETISALTDSDNEISYVNERGYILSGDEFFTVFDGLTGKAEDTIYYPNQRVDVTVWGDDYGGRTDRNTACIAWLDGEKPYAVYMSGYYMRKSGSQFGERQTACAISFDGEKLSCDYCFDTFDAANAAENYPNSYSYSAEGVYKGVDGYKEGNEIYVGEGNHNCSVADVDNDGMDEVLTGPLCYEIKDGMLGVKWCNFMEHGNILHIGDYDPTNLGFELFTTHEGHDKVNSLSGVDVPINYGATLIDACTGATLFHVDSKTDAGRGMMANTGQGGYYQLTASAQLGTFVIDGIVDGSAVYTEAEIEASKNFRIFWDGDLYDELLDGTEITSWEENFYATVFSADGCTSINDTKSTPSLQADLLGDWREEVIYPTKDNTALRVFITTTPTNYKLKTLMHDPVYRSGVTAEQTAYNQPPHVGFYMDSELFDKEIPVLRLLSAPSKTRYTVGTELDINGLELEASYENGSTMSVSPDKCVFSGFDPYTKGSQTVYVTYMGQTVDFDITVLEMEDIFISQLPNTTVNYQGAPLNADGLAVSARYSDGSVEELKSDEYSISYSSDTLGTQEVTVTYMDKSTSFEVSVIEPNAAALNRNYYNGSTESSLMTIPVGTLAGNFTLKHKVMVNSMPADCTADKDDANGFFMRFINTGRTQIGGGWYLSSADDDVLVSWKGAPTPGKPGTGGGLCRIEPGKTYTFKYEFRDVGTSTENGAYVNVEVIDEDGNTIGSATGLDLRNFTQTNYGKETYITAVQVYNQARSDSPGSVTIDDVSAYGTGGTVSVEGTIVTAELEGITQNERVIAAKYNNDILTKVETFDSLELGDNALEASFIPDKVFLWSGMIPLCDPNTSSLAN